QLRTLLVVLHRYADLGRRLPLVLGGEAPAPLERLHVHDHIRVGGQPGDLVLVARGEVEQDRDHDDRYDGVEDLDRQVVAHLGRQLLVGAPLLAMEDAGPDDQAPYDTAGGKGGDPRSVPQRLDDVALSADGLGHATTCPLVGATGRRGDQQQRQSGGARHHAAGQRTPSRTAGRTHGSPTPQIQPGSLSRATVYVIRAWLGDTLAVTTVAPPRSPRHVAG